MKTLLYYIVTILSFGNIYAQQVTIYQNGINTVVRYINSNGNYDFAYNVIHSIGRHDGNNGVYSGDTIGIAPNSQWIAARIPNNPVDENFTNYALACFNWVINMPPQYRPDIINCSFYDQSKGKYNFDCYNVYLEVLQQLEDLCVAVVFAAGNDGLNCF